MGDDGVRSPHQIATAPDLARPVGYAHAVVAAPGRTVYLGGQTAQDRDGAIVGDTMAAQLDVAAGNVVAALRAANGYPEQLVSMVVYVTDVPGYRDAMSELGPLWRKHFGRHYPAIALIGVAGLFDPEARIEIVATAVIPG